MFFSFVHHYLIMKSYILNNADLFNGKKKTIARETNDSSEITFFQNMALYPL